MLARLLMRLYVAACLAACAAGVVYVYAWPPQSLQVTRDGVPHLAPPVIDPRTEEAVSLQQLVQHYKGGR